MASKKSLNNTRVKESISYFAKRNFVLQFSELSFDEQKKIKSNVYQTEAIGKFNPKGVEYDIKFLDVMILSEQKVYTFAYSNLVENFEAELPRFKESLNSFEILSSQSNSSKSIENTDREIMTREEFLNSETEGGGCLIATAAYGSELAPQVQMLREIRDNQLMNTESGSAFMSGFNELYYSFSPTIADMQRESPVFKEIVKLAITPMINTLSIMEGAETESQVLGLGISVIALNLGMYVGLPAIVIFGIKKRN